MGSWKKLSLLFTLLRVTIRQRVKKAYTIKYKINLHTPQSNFIFDDIFSDNETGNNCLSQQLSRVPSSASLNNIQYVEWNSCHVCPALLP